jgi:hypothetical protein
MTSKKQIFIYRALAIALGLLLTSGCVSHRPGFIPNSMQAAGPPPLTPPPGKCLVCFHNITLFSYTSTTAWDGTNFVAAVANGQSAAAVFDPGKHVFASRFLGQAVGVIEADLLPDQIYDLSAFKYLYLTPVKQGEKEHDLVSQWMKDAIWVTRGPNAAEFETTHKDVIIKLISDYTVGKKQDRLMHLAPEDHR